MISNSGERLFLLGSEEVLKEEEEDSEGGGEGDHTGPVLLPKPQGSEKTRSHFIPNPRKPMGLVMGN